MGMGRHRSESNNFSVAGWVIAVFFLASGVGTALSGVLGGYFDTANQTPYWLSVGGSSVVLGLLALTLTKPMLKLLRGIR